MPERRIAMLLAHGEGLVREALATMLEGHGFDVPHQVDSLDSLFDCARNGGRTADVVLVQSDLPGIDGRQLERLSELGRVVLLSRPSNAEEPASLLRAGVSGSLSLNLDAERFVQSLRLIVQGDVVVSGDVATAAAEPGPSFERSGGDTLTDREQEVLELVAAGATNREIAETLIITQHTVKVHLSHILEKLNLRNRQQVAAWAVRNGVLTETAPPEGEGVDQAAP